MLCLLGLLGLFFISSSASLSNAPQQTFQDTVYGHENERVKDWRDNVEKPKYKDEHHVYENDEVEDDLKFEKVGTPVNNDDEEDKKEDKYGWDNVLNQNGGDKKQSHNFSVIGLNGACSEPVFERRLSRRDIVIGVPIGPRPVDVFKVSSVQFMDHASTNTDALYVAFTNGHGAHNTPEVRKVHRKNGWITGCRMKDYDVKLQIENDYGDKPDRVKWRTFEALDYLQVLNTSYHLGGEFIMICQDDVRPSINVAEKAYQSAKQFYSEGITVMGAYTSGGGAYGAVAICFHESVVPSFMEYITKHYKERPIDFLFLKWLQASGQRSKQRFPNLFQHTGDKSTFDKNNGIEHDARPWWKSHSFVYDEHNRTCQVLAQDADADGYIGCFADKTDHINYRDLQGYLYKVDNIDACRKRCHGKEDPKEAGNFLYFGMSGEKCYCGNDFGKYGKYPDSECDETCGDKSCGGAGFNSVYKL